MGGCLELEVREKWDHPHDQYTNSYVIILEASLGDVRHFFSYTSTEGYGTNSDPEVFSFLQLAKECSSATPRKLLPSRHADTSNLFLLLPVRHLQLVRVIPSKIIATSWRRRTISYSTPKKKQQHTTRQFFLVGCIQGSLNGPGH